MLALSRKINESVIVGDNIRIVVVDIRGDKVRLGIEAPADVAVFRSEVYEKIQKEREENARAAKIREAQASAYAATADFAQKTLAFDSNVFPPLSKKKENAADSTEKSDEKGCLVYDLSTKKFRSPRLGKTERIAEPFDDAEKTSRLATQDGSEKSALKRR